MKIQRSTLTDQAAEVLLRRIGNKEWLIGSKIPGENALAPELGIGRSTVREAIRKLVGQGVLVSRQGKGVFVTSYEASEDWSEVLAKAGIVEVIEGRMAIESEAAALAAERYTEFDLEAMRFALDMRKAAKTIDSFVDADNEFHRCVVRASQNGILLEIFDQFVPRVREAMLNMLLMQNVFGSTEDHTEHSELVDAIASGVAANAAQKCRTHLREMVSTLTP